MLPRTYIIGHQALESSKLTLGEQLGNMAESLSTNNTQENDNKQKPCAEATQWYVWRYGALGAFNKIRLTCLAPSVNSSMLNSESK